MITIKKAGKVTHYYDKLGVAIIDLQTSIAAGDKIKFTRGGEDMFEQKVESMQLDHKEVSTAKKGDAIGLKTEKEVKEGAEVFKI